MQFQLNMQNTQKSNLDNSQCRPSGEANSGQRMPAVGTKRRYLNIYITKGSGLNSESDWQEWGRRTLEHRSGCCEAAATKVCNQQFAYLLWQWQKLSFLSLKPLSCTLLAFPIVRPRAESLLVLFASFFIIIFLLCC